MMQQMNADGFLTIVAHNKINMKIKKLFINEGFCWD